MEIRELNAEELTALNDGLALLLRVANEEHLVTFAGLQNVYDTIITDKPDFPELVISLGLGFGQQFVETGRYEWVRVSDEYGEETVISPKGYRTIASPISMIQKRIERDETIELENFYNTIDKSMTEMIVSGKYDKR